jgi:hypothetical protein
MLRKAFLAAVVALLLPTLLAADIVVLKHGRRIEARGRYTIEAGVVKFTGVDSQAYQFPLEAVDLRASEQASAEAAKPHRPKVWTNDDLELLKETAPVSVMGTARAAAPAAGEAEAEAVAEGEAAEAEPVPGPPKEQTREYWQERLQPLRDELNRIEQQLQRLRRGQGQAASNAVDVMGSNPGVQVEDTIQQLERRRAQVQQQIAAIQAEARRAGVPPGYVR